MAFMADRMAIMLVTLKQRHGDDWSPWMGEGLWEDEDGMGDVLRSWPDYEVAMKIIRLWIRKHDKKDAEDGRNITNTANTQAIAS